MKAVQLIHYPLHMFFPTIVPDMQVGQLHRPQRLLQFGQPYPHLHHLRRKCLMHGKNGHSDRKQSHQAAKQPTGHPDETMDHIDSKHKQRQKEQETDHHATGQ